MTKRGRTAAEVTAHPVGANPVVTEIADAAVKNGIVDGVRAKLPRSLMAVGFTEAEVPMLLERFDAEVAAARKRLS